MEDFPPDFCQLFLLAADLYVISHGVLESSEIPGYTFFLGLHLNVACTGYTWTLYKWNELVKHGLFIVLTKIFRLFTGYPNRFFCPTLF